MDVKSYIKMELNGISRNLDRILKGLEASDLSWRPAAGCNSIGLILFHCARSEDGFIHRNLAQKPQVFEKWYKKMNKAADDGGAHYTLDQVNAFVVPDLKDIMDYWAEVRAETIVYIDSLTEADLEKKIKMQWGEFNVAGILSLTVSHTVGHIGEMSYLRGLYRGMDK
jgi:uncharacterized damage-inducible protein DinB